MFCGVCSYAGAPPKLSGCVTAKCAGWTRNWRVSCVEPESWLAKSPLGKTTMEAEQSQMTEIWRELRERFPLLDRVVVQALGQEKAESFPSFFSLFLAALDDREGPPCCFVLPRRGEMARLAAIIFGLSIFRRDFNALAKQYAEQEFSVGQHVRVHPGKHVFAFGGFWPDQPHQFRL